MCTHWPDKLVPVFSLLRSLTAGSSSPVTDVMSLLFLLLLHSFNMRLEDFSSVQVVHLHVSRKLQMLFQWHTCSYTLKNAFSHTAYNIYHSVNCAPRDRSIQRQPRFASATGGAIYWELLDYSACQGHLRGSGHRKGSFSCNGLPHMVMIREQ